MGASFSDNLGAAENRSLSLPKSVAAKGGIKAWNTESEEVANLCDMSFKMCTASTVEEALQQVKALMSMGHNLPAYAYMRMLYFKNLEVYYGALLAEPSTLLPVVYTPTVGEACQKFGKMPFYPRGCYVSITDRGNFKKVLEDYAAAHLSKDSDGKYLCDCIVFSDGGRILGLGDLGTWGMGIPIGKLDLYTVCGGVNPYRTVPVIIDAGCYDSSGNTDKLVIRDHELYTGLKQNRVTNKNAAGVDVNSAYYGPGNMIEEFMQAAVDIFGKNCLLQFEDFNSNDAFPLLAEYREKFLTYNDDIQGTAAVTVAALLGAIKLKNPTCTDLISELKKEVFLFHGAGSANIGTMKLLADEAGVPKSQLNVTNSRGVIWKEPEAPKPGMKRRGSFRNDEQEEFARMGEPGFDGKNLVAAIENLKPTALIGAVGRDPGCFDKAVVDAMLKVNGDSRPGIYALSNPKTQAEITSTDCWKWSDGKCIYGSGTGMETVQIGDKTFCPGQVNNVYIFPGVSMGAICCQASTIPERLFMVAAEAVANSLDAQDLLVDSVVPDRNKIRICGLNVAAAVVFEAQKLGIAGRHLGKTLEEVKAQVQEMMWAPEVAMPVAPAESIPKVVTSPIPVQEAAIGA